MPLIVSFGVFTIAMVICLVTGHTIIIGLSIGLIAFGWAGIRSGFTLPQVARYAWEGVKGIMILVEIMIMIGFMTGLWRASGTITYFVYYGLKLIQPSLFVLLAFVMTAALGYIMGNMFASLGTMGLILMALAASGGVDPAVTAGAILSGAIFGDRSSPLSSTPILVASITKDVEYSHYIRRLMTTNLLPLGITTGLYVVFSIHNPIAEVDRGIVEALAGDFRLTAWSMLPILLVILILLLKLDVRIAFIAGIVSSFFVALLLQECSAGQLVRCMLTGYEPKSQELQGIISGGGVVEMISILIIVCLSCSFSGIFKGTGMLTQIQGGLTGLTRKIGRFPVTFILSTIIAAVMCSQTISIMLTGDLMMKIYKDTGDGEEEFAVDIANAGIVTCGMIPWNVMLAASLVMLGVGNSTIPYIFYVFAVPVCWFFTKRIWYR